MKEKKSIYVVWLCQYAYDKPDIKVDVSEDLSVYISHGDDITPGFFFSLEDAIGAVENNHENMADGGHFKYAAIAKIKEGVFSRFDKKNQDFAPMWFKFNTDTDKYEKIETPKGEGVGSVYGSIW